jgi:hypothetical protein
MPLQGWQVTRRGQQPGDTVPDYLRQSADAEGRHRHPVGHGLQRGQRQTLVARGHAQQADIRPPRRHVVHHAVKLHPRAMDALKRGAHRAVAEQVETRFRHVLGQPAEQIRAFFRTEPPDESDSAGIAARCFRRHGDEILDPPGFPGQLAQNSLADRDRMAQPRHGPVEREVKPQPTVSGFPGMVCRYHRYFVQTT